MADALNFDVRHGRCQGCATRSDEHPHGRHRAPCRWSSRNSICEQVFKNLDDVLWKEAGCTTELDYTEQSSWMPCRARIRGRPAFFASSFAVSGVEVTADWMGRGTDFDAAGAPGQRGAEWVAAGVVLLC